MPMALSHTDLETSLHTGYLSAPTWPQAYQVSCKQGVNYRPNIGIKCYLCVCFLHSCSLSNIARLSLWYDYKFKACLSSCPASENLLQLCISLTPLQLWSLIWLLWRVWWSVSCFRCLPIGCADACPWAEVEALRKILLSPHHKPVIWHRDQSGSLLTHQPVKALESPFPISRGAEYRTREGSRRTSKLM